MKKTTKTTSPAVEKPSKAAKTAKPAPKTKSATRKSLPKHKDEMRSVVNNTPAAITTDIGERLKVFQENQLELSKIISCASEVTGLLHMAVEKDLAKLSERVKNDTFKVMVTGTFKNGKSALINALLGEKILPSYALPCTAVINVIKYGSEKKAFVHFKKELPSELPSSLAQEAVDHMKKHAGQEIPPLEIPYEKIEDYVVIPIGADAEQMKLQTPYEKVELFYPLEILKNGIEIIDSPGMNEDAIRTQTTMDYLGRVDAVLYVFNACAITAQDELRFVEQDLAGNNYEAVIFVINKIDQVDPDERDGIRKFAQVKLSGIYPHAPIFNVSAKNALDGRISCGTELLEASGLPELERHLAEFLVRERGKAKLAQPAKQIRKILGTEALGKAIPAERALLAKSLAEIQEKQEELLPRLSELEKQKEVLKASLEAKVERFAMQMERLSKRRFDSMSDNIRAWVDEFKPQTSKIPYIPTKSSIQPVVAELLAFLKAKTKDDQIQWRKKILDPEIEKEGKKLFDDAERDFSAIFREIDAIRMNVADTGSVDLEPVPFWQRVVGAAGTLAGCYDGPTVALYGLNKGFFQTLAIKFGAIILLSAIGMPFVVPIAIIIGLFTGVATGRQTVLNKIKTTVTNHAVSENKNHAEENAQKVANGIKDAFGKIVLQIASAVDNDIGDLRNRLQSILKEKSEGESACNQRRRELAECEKAIGTLNSRLDDLIFKVAEVR